MAKEFYAALIPDSYRVDSERSRNKCVAAHTFTKVEEFDSREQMQKWVELQESTNKIKYRIVKCIPMESREDDIQEYFDSRGLGNTGD